MPAKNTNRRNLQRETLRKIAKDTTTSTKKQRIAELAVLYSEESRLLTNYINKLVNMHNIYPRHLPTQASFRWSTVDPPLTNWPRRCINTTCPQEEHEWSDTCWSIRDMVRPPTGYVMVTWDHDNIEGRIHDLIVNDPIALKAHRDGLDLHTITCCTIFGYSLPSDLKNPHSSPDDATWRMTYNWQGKDTKQRVLAKNFNHGSKYTETYKFVHKIEGIEKYGITRQHLEGLAKAYIASKGTAWQRKLDIMHRIRRDKVSRTVYGARRCFYTSDPETGRQGFSHMISGTVSHYNDMTLIMFEDMFKEDMITKSDTATLDTTITQYPQQWLSHNAHDGDKIFIRKDMVPSKDELLKVIQRDIEYEGRSITLTAGVKVYE